MDAPTHHHPQLDSPCNHEYHQEALKHITNLLMEDDDHHQLEAITPGISRRLELEAVDPKHRIDPNGHDLMVPDNGIRINPPFLSSNQTAPQGYVSSYVSCFASEMLREGGGLNLEDHAPVNGFSNACAPVDGFDPRPPPATDDRSLAPPDGYDCVSKSSFFSTMLQYINDMLMEGDLDDVPSIFQDSLALQAAEKCLYDVLVDNSHVSSDQNADTDGEIGGYNSEIGGCNSKNRNADDNLADSNWILSQQELDSGDRSFSESVTDLHTQLSSHLQLNGTVVYANSRGRKAHKRNDDDDGYSEARRSNKLSCSSSNEVEQLEIIDSGFLQKVEKKDSIPCPLYDASRNEASKRFQEEEQSQASSYRVQRLIGSREKVDLFSLLNQCAGFAGSGDQRSAAEYLQQIRKHSSSRGDANQRLAHYFANGLEMRLWGTGNAPAPANLITTAEILKAYQMYASICPFRKVTNIWTSVMITKEIENRSWLHIIDFGIWYGFQWPCFLHSLTVRPGGPPVVRITGIEFPQKGFRPAERTEETGRRLKRLAATLKVPLEYNAIAKKWETITYDDLQIEKGEVIAVTCMYRLKNLPDDTMVLSSPRDSVLKLIRKINPHIFIHGVANGSFNAPFFVTRFREAMYHYSAIFDMFEANAQRDDPERLVFEQEFIGKGAVNVITCEGFERVERPETYKQWQSRNCRIGFRQLPLDQQLVDSVKSVNSNYHKDFLADQDGRWMVMGWKGRIIHAISAWKPVCHN